MTTPIDDLKAKLLKSVFRMPAVQTMVSRKSSITNAFVNSLIPVVEPSPTEIEHALHLLAMTPDSVCCAYCGDKYTEWDHLRPLVVNHRPTGFISEIANLVPSCGKCNQSKGNKHWLKWILSNAPHAPARRGTPDLAQRVARLQAYEAWRDIRPIPFETIVGPDAYADYWSRLDHANAYLRDCQAVAERLRATIAAAHAGPKS